MVVMKSAVTNSFSVEMLQENASPRGGNATTTKIVKMARTNMTVVSTLKFLLYVVILLEREKKYVPLLKKQFSPQFNRGF
jgi:hypothetical protein